MRFPGSRRARLVVAAMLLFLVGGLWHASRLYVAQLRKSLAPTLLARLRTALQRDIQVDRLVVDRPGSVVAEGVRVARGPTFKEGTFVTAERLEITYDPSLLEWGSLITRAMGRNTRARARVTGIRVPQHPGKGDFATVESAETSVDFGAALRGRPNEVLGSIDRVDVRRAMVHLVRTQAGNWNYEQILKLPKSTRPSTFRGEIVLAESGVEFTDYHSAGLPAPAINRARGEGVLRFAGFPRLQWTVAGTIGGVHGGPFKAHGTQHSRDKDWFVSLDAGTSDMRYWYRYVATDQTALDVVSGRAKARLVAWGVAKKPAETPRFSLTLDVSTAEARMTAIKEPLRAFRGVIRVDPSFIGVDGTTLLGKAPIRVSADVTRSVPIRTELRLSSNALTLSGLRRAFPNSTLPAELVVSRAISTQAVMTAVGKHWTVRGTGSTSSVAYRETGFQNVVAEYRAQVDDGTVTALSAHVRSASGHFRDVTADSVRADIRSRGKVMDVAAQFKSFGGDVSGDGWVEIGENPSFYVTGKLDGLKLSQVPWKQEQQPRIAGLVSGPFVATGTVDAPRVDVTLRAVDAAYEEESVDEIAARVHWTRDLVEIPYATVTDGRGQVLFNGTVRDGNLLDLHASAERVELGPLLSGRVKQEVGGSAYLTADITGTLEDPRVIGRVQVYQPRLGEHQADYVEARVAALGLQRIELSAVKLNRAPAEATADLVFLSRTDEHQPWQLGGEVEVRGLTIVQALRAAGVPLKRLRESPVSGDLGPINLKLAGDVENLKAGFTGSAASVAVAGLDLGEVDGRGDLDLSERRVRLTELTSSSTLGTATVSGELRWQQDDSAPDKAVETDIDLQVDVANVRLSPLLRRYAPDIGRSVRAQGGVARAKAAIRGRLSALQVSAQVELSGLILNERAVEVEPFNVEWTSAAALVRNATAHFGSGLLRLPYMAILLEPGAEKLPWAQRVAGSVVIEHIPVAVTRQLLEDSPYFRTEKADSIREALALWRSPVGGDVSGAIRIDPGPSGVPATVLAAAQLLRARTDEPAITGNLEIPNLVSPPGSEQPPTQLVAAATYRGNRLDLREFRLQQEGGATASVSGTFDRSVEGRPAELRFSARASDVPLRSLSLLPVADVRERLEQFQPLDGLMQLRAEVSGTEKAPKASFTVDIGHPVVYGVPFDHFKLAQGEYDGAKGELRVSEAGVTKQLDGVETAGILFSGTLPVTWPELSSPRTATRRLTVQVPDQSLKVFSALATDAEAYAAKGGETASERVKALVSVFRQVAATEGRIAGQATLGGTAAQPRNEGGFALTDATFRIDGLQTAIKKFNARLELAGDQVRVAEFTGESSQGGDFTGGGVVRLGRDINGKPIPNLDLSLTVRRFRFAEKQVSSLLGEAFLGTQFSGTLDTVSIATPEQPRALTIRGDWPTPIVEGGVRLDESNLLLAYEDKGLPERPVERPDIRLNLRFFAGNSVWLRNPQLRLKIEGSVLASNTTAEPVITGDLPVTEGNLTLVGLRLRNAEGVIRVAYDRRNEDLGVSPPPPVYVDIGASTSLRVVRAVADEAEYVDATFEIRGAPGGGGAAGIRQTGVGGGLSVGSDSGLTLTVRTDPPLPSREIEALIRQQFGVEGFSGSGANVVEALRGQIEQAFAINVTSALTGRIENALQSALGLSTMSLDLGISQPLRVRLGKRLFGPVYGTVSQEFGSVNSQRQFELYYRINPQLRIGIRQEDPPGRKVFFFSGTATF